MASTTVWFITGANRGLGLEYINQLSKRQNVFVYATARNPATATALNAIASKHSNVEVVKVDGPEDITAAAKLVASKHGRVDVLVANAGTVGESASSDPQEVDQDDLKYVFEVNYFNVIALYQAFYELLLKSSNAKFVPISTIMGSITLLSQLPMSAFAYGSSKAALNFATHLISLKAKGKIIAIPLHPGWVNTEMGFSAARAMGLERAPVTPEDSVVGQLKVIDNVTAEESGRFLQFDGGVAPW